MPPKQNPSPNKKEKDDKKDDKKDDNPQQGQPFAEIEEKLLEKAKKDFLGKQKEYIVEKDIKKQYFDAAPESANSVTSCVKYLLNDEAVKVGLMATNKARTIDSIGFSAKYTPFHLIMEVGPFCINGPIGVNKVDKEGLSLKDKYDNITGAIVKQVCRDLANEYKNRGELLPEKSWCYINNDKDYWPFGKQQRDDEKIIEDAKKAKEEKRK
eukprot:GHVR01179827.1.p1 GENE.GHVR01179827.1~~GHVR01179827.1.p1  ORF type:complete len:211 (-),score=63.36 GHVR01179827.1:385-1017(-)